MAIATPWGMSNSNTKYIRGIIFCGTPRHGGFHVSRMLNEKIHPAWRKADGWYEEDCEWAIVAITFPGAFTKEIMIAHATAKNYFPLEYEAATGIKVTPEESHTLRDIMFREEHKSDYIALSATTISIPEGFVGVFAGRGGRLQNGLYPDDVKHFIVPLDEYRERIDGNFSVDESRHKEYTPII